MEVASVLQIGFAPYLVPRACDFFQFYLYSCFRPKIVRVTNAAQIPCISQVVSCSVKASRGNSVLAGYNAILASYSINKLNGPTKLVKLSSLKSERVNICNKLRICFLETDHVTGIPQGLCKLQKKEMLRIYCISVDAARGLSYLHEGMDFQIIFKDFKSSNILLDEQWNAKLSDFGLARLGPSDGLSHVSTAV